jgi:hypothetical protein
MIKFPLRRFAPGHFRRARQLQQLTLARRAWLATVALGKHIEADYPVAGATTYKEHLPPNPADGNNYVNCDHLPLFGPNGPSADDVYQSFVGNCHRLAPLQSIAIYRPELLREMIVRVAPNLYAVRFWRAGVDHWVYVNADIPDNATFVKNGPIWPSIHQKADAFFRYYNVSTNVSPNTYASLSMGWVGSAYADFGFSSKLVSPVAAGWAAITLNLEKKWPASISTRKPITNGAPFIEQHAHAVVSIVGDILTAENPWGIDGIGSDSNPLDGTVTTTLAIASGAITAMAHCVGYTPPVWAPKAYVPIPARNPADANSDGVVDFDDFTILSQHFGQSTNRGYADGDFDGDGKVTFADFAILARNFAPKAGDTRTLPAKFPPEETPMIEFKFVSPAITLDANNRSAFTMSEAETFKAKWETNADAVKFKTGVPGWGDGVTVLSPKNETQTGLPAGTFTATFTATKAGSPDFIATITITVTKSTIPIPDLKPVVKTLASVEVVTTSIYSDGSRGVTETKLVK